jgi:integrase
MYVVAAYTGLRLGELLALRRRDIDYGKRLVHVRRSYVTGQEEMPRSGRGRSVPMTDQVMVVLDSLSRRGRFTAEHELVFPNAVGEHLDGSALRRRFYASMERAAVKRIRFSRPAPHLRHARGSGPSAHRRQGVHGARRHQHDDDLCAPRSAARCRPEALRCAASGILS